MNTKRWVLAAVAAAVAVTVIESVFHGVVLAGLYQATASVWRPESQMSKLIPFGWLSTLIIKKKQNLEFGLL